MPALNPSFQNQADEFTGLSRGIQGDTSLANLFENSGNLIQADTQAADQIIKQNINEEARNKVEPIRDAVTYALETGQLQGGKSNLGNAPDVPPGVEDGLNHVENLTRGKDSGRLGESHYFNLLDAEARRLRAQHPGYKDYVDQRIAELTGGNPANKMVQELYQEQRAGATAANKEYDYWEKKAVEQGQAPDIEQRKREGRPYTVGQLREKVATYQAQESQIRVSRERMADELQKGRVIKERVGNQASKEVGYIVNDTLRAGIGPYDSAQDALNKAAEKKAAGGSFTPEEFDQLRNAYGALEQTVDAKIAKVFTQIDPATKLRYGDHLDNKEIDQIVKTAKMPLEAMKNAIFDKDTGTIGSIASRLQANIENDTNRIYSNSQHAANIMQYQKFYGSQWVALLAGSNDPKAFKDVMQKSIFEDSMHRTMDPNKKDNSFSQEYEQLKQAKADPDTFNKAINTHISVLASSKPDPKLFEKSAMVMFGPNNKDMFYKDNGDGTTTARWTDPQGLYQRIAGNPTIAKNIIASGNSTLINNYKDWVGTNFATMMEQSAETAKQLATSSKFSDLEFNPTTLQFQVSPSGKTPSMIPAASPFGLADGVRQILDRNSTAAVRNINSVLAGMTNLIKASGGNPAEELPKMVQQLGIPPSDNKGPDAMESLWNTMMNKLSLSQAQEQGSNVPTPTKATGTLTASDRKFDYNSNDMNKFIAMSPYGTYARDANKNVVKQIAPGVWHKVTEKNGKEVIGERIY